MLRYVYAGFLLFFITMTAHTQDRANYALLWEVSGKHLSSPSYVFGSMHVRDEFAFEFPDSLYTCLMSCDAFANEVELDSAMYRVLDIYINDKTLDVDSSYIKFIDSKFVEQDSSLSNNYSITDLLEKKDTLSLELPENESPRATPLDAYLMNIARGLKKETYGLEKIDHHLYDKEDQTQSIFSLFGTSYDELKKYYYAGDIEQIQKMIEQEAAAYNNLDLIPRNYIMVESMQRIMETESLFAVVGAAHLPGPEGVIELLKQEGYQLRKVTAEFTGHIPEELQDLQLLTKKRPWPSLNTVGANFELATPLPLVIKKEDLLESRYIHIDIGRGLNYLMLMNSQIPYIDEQDFEQYYFEQEAYDVIDTKDIQLAGLDAKAYELQKWDDDMPYYRAYSLVHNGEFYYLQVGAYEEEVFAETKDHQLFINSFNIKEKNHNKWITLTDSISAFKLLLPKQYTYRKYTDDFYETDYHHYSAGFGSTSKNVSFMHYSADTYQVDSTELKEAVSYLEDQYGIDIDIDEKQTNEWGQKWLLSAAFENQALFLHAFVQSRGKKIFVLSTVDEQKPSVTKKFLSAFKLLPLQQAPSRTYVIADSALSIQMPVTDIVSYSNAASTYSDVPHISFYTQNGKDDYNDAEYYIGVRKLHPEFGTTDTLAYIKDAIYDLDFEYDYGQVYETSISKQWPEFSYIYKGDEYYKKNQYYIAGPYLINKSITAIDSTVFEQTNAKAFFENDRWLLAPTKEGNLLEDRSEELLFALAQDSLDYQKTTKIIHGGFNFSPSQAKHIAALLVGQNWPAEKSNRLKSKLINALVALKTTDTPLLLKDVFKSSGIDVLHRTEILGHLLYEAQDSSSAAYMAAYLDLLSEQALIADIPFSAFEGLKHEPSLLLPHIDLVAAQLKSRKDHPLLWDICRALYQESQEGKAAVNSIKAAFLERGFERLHTYTAGSLPPRTYNYGKANFERNAAYHVVDLFKLLLKEGEAKEELEQLMARPATDRISVETMRLLLASFNSIDKRITKRLLSNPNTWLATIRVLNEYKYLDELKKKFYKQEEVAKGLLIERSLELGEPISDIELEEVIETSLNGQPKRFYSFTFKADGRPMRLAVVGVFSDQAEERHFEDRNAVSLTSYAVTKRRRSKKAKALIKAYEDLGDD